MNPIFRKKLLDLLWAGAVAAGAAFLASVIPGLKELLGELLTESAAPFLAAFTVIMRNV